jgi:hypothetical protein
LKQSGPYSSPLYSCRPFECIVEVALAVMEGYGRGFAERNGL